MSRNPNSHSYVPYTGKPYIFFAGVPLNTQFQCGSSPEHPIRTIIQTPEGVSNKSSNQSDKSYRLYQKNCNHTKNN